MPVITPLAEISQMAADQPIMLIQGRVLNVYQPKSGGSEADPYGPWKFQSITIQDASGTKIDVKLKNRHAGDDVPTSWKGKDIIIENIKTDQGGFKSVSAWDDEYKGKTTRKIKVTATAAVYLAGDTSRGQGNQGQASPAKSAPAKQAAPAPAKQQAPPVQQHQHQQEAAPADEAATALRDARHTVARDANLYCLCLGAVQGVVAPYYTDLTGAPMTAEHFQAAVATLFIQAARENASTGLPVQPIPLPSQKAEKK